MSLEVGGTLYEGETHRSKGRRARGLEVLISPAIPLPSGAAVEVVVELFPGTRAGELRLRVDGAEMVRVAPLAVGASLEFRLAGGEWLVVTTAASRAG